MLAICKEIKYGKQDMDTLYEFIQSWSKQVLEKHNPYNPGDTLAFAGSVAGAVKYHYFWTLADICEIAGSVEAENNVTPIKVV